MKNANRWLCAAACLGILAAATCAFAQDWPQWRGANRDGKAAGFTAPAEWPKTLTPAWSVKVGEGDATPALVGDRLYCYSREGADEVVRCLSAADGKELWKAACPAPAIEGPAAKQHAGPRSSPAVAEGKVVVLGINGNLMCFDAADGKILWRKEDVKAVPQFYTASSPLIVDGMAVAHLGGKGTGALVACDLATGAVKWKVDAQPASYASPALMTACGVKQVVSLTEKGLIGVGLADGKLLWEFPFAPSGRMSYNAATPVVDGDKVYVFGSGRGGKALQVGKDGETLVAKELWNNADASVQFSTPVLSGACLFGFSDRGALFCVNAADGSTAWKKDVVSGRGVGFAGLVDAGSAILALPNNSDLIVFKSAAGGYEELAKIKVSDAQTYAHPVLSGKRLFIKDADSLKLFTLP